MRSKRENKTQFDLDARVKLLIVIETGTLTFLTGKNALITVAFLSSFVVLLWFKQSWTAIRFLAAFLGVLAIDCLISFIEIQTPKMVLGMLTFFILRMLPVLMLGSWLVRTVKINDFITSLAKMKFPNSIVIPLAVTLRFMPTIKTEFRHIKNTMKLRGISLSAGAVLRRPLMTTEYAMVPLLMRSVRVADELSASALTRGIGRRAKRTSYRDVRLTGADIAWAAAFTVFVAGVCLADRLVV